MFIILYSISSNVWKNCIICFTSMMESSANSDLSKEKCQRNNKNGTEKVARDISFYQLFLPT